MINDPDDPDTVITYGGAKPGDGNFADVFAVDDDILEVIAERERRRKEKQERRCRSLGDVGCDRARLVAGEQVGRATRRSDMSGCPEWGISGSARFALETTLMTT
jgi:hypothetical protein